MFSKIASFPNIWEAEIVNVLLTEHGLHPLSLENSSHIFFAGADLFYYVQVPETEVPTAIKVLNDNGYAKSIM